MTHQPLTKAEREELGRLHAEAELNKNGDWEVECDEAFRVACMDKMFRLLADLDAAEAKISTQFQTTFDELRKALGSDIGSEGGLCAILTGIEQIKAQRDAAQERVDLDIDEFRRILAEMGNLRVCIPMTPEDGRGIYDLVQGIVLRATNAGRQRVPLIAQRDRAEAELDAERRMRVEAEAAARRAEEERDALKAKLAALVDSCRSAETILGNMAKETGRTFGRWEIHHEPLRNDAQRMLQSFRAAIAAARGGAS